jgi:hypothetical protein
MGMSSCYGCVRTFGVGDQTGIGEWGWAVAADVLAPLGSGGDANLRERHPLRNLVR